jgi:invasion protein IalB
MNSRRLRTALVILLLSCDLAWAQQTVAGQKFEADEWVTECDGAPGMSAPDCAITVPFWQAGDSPKGSFALVVMLQTGNIGIVGQPFPTRAVLRVDKNPPIECSQPRYCIFPSMQSLNVLKQLRSGSLILIDVYAQKKQFSFSLTPKGFQAGIAKIRAWGYRTQ